MTDTTDVFPHVLQQALRGGARPGVDVLRGERPPLLDAETVRALTSIFLAAFMIAAAVFRARVTPAAFDLLGLILRTASLAFVLRSVILIGSSVARIVTTREGPQHALAWSREGVLWKSPAGEQAFAREDIVAVITEQTRGRLAASLSRPVLLVLSPRTGRTHVALPPYFGRADVLSARLEQAFGEQETSRPLPRPPSVAAEERYQRAARGERAPLDIIIPEGRSYLWRGPYASLLGIPFALDAMFAAERAGGSLRSAGLLACALAVLVPVSYVWLARRRSRSRLGIAMLLAREELVVRGPRGAFSLPWNQLEQAEVRVRDVWSPFVGSYPARQLVVQGRDGTTIPFDGGFLGVPPEVVATLCRAYARGAFEPASEQADGPDA
jgi:hypothetical protein